MSVSSTIANVGIAIASNGRCPPLLAHIVGDWLARGVPVSVAGGDRALSACEPLSAGAGHGSLRLVAHPDGPRDQGSQIAAAFDALEDVPFVLLGADDILPVGAEGNAWVQQLSLTANSIRSVRMIDMRGRRWFDWACRTDRGAFIQGYDEHRPRTFITGGSQLWSRQARELVSYRGRPYRTGADAQVCEDAEAAGIDLLPPAPDGPLLVHLDRRPDHINRAR